VRARVFGDQFIRACCAWIFLARGMRIEGDGAEKEEKYEFWCEKLKLGFSVGVKDKEEVHSSVDNGHTKNIN
jgi:hypothetical protein